MDRAQSEHLWFSSNLSRTRDPTPHQATSLIRKCQANKQHRALQSQPCIWEARLMQMDLALVVGISQGISPSRRKMMLVITLVSILPILRLPTPCKQSLQSNTLTSLKPRPALLLSQARVQTQLLSTVRIRLTFLPMLRCSRFSYLAVPTWVPIKNCLNSFKRKFSNSSRPLTLTKRRMSSSRPRLRF